MKKRVLSFILSLAMIASFLPQTALFASAAADMPGHGGVLDRIDGTLFATMVVYLAFALLRVCL